MWDLSFCNIEELYIFYRFYYEYSKLKTLRCYSKKYFNIFLQNKQRTNSKTCTFHRVFPKLFCVRKYDQKRIKICTGIEYLDRFIFYGYPRRILVVKCDQWARAESPAITLLTGQIQGEYKWKSPFRPTSLCLKNVRYVKLSCVQRHCGYTLTIFFLSVIYRR